MSWNVRYFLLQLGVKNLERHSPVLPPSELLVFWFLSFVSVFSVYSFLWPFSGLNHSPSWGPYIQVLCTQTFLHPPNLSISQAAVSQCMRCCFPSSPSQTLSLICPPEAKRRNQLSPFFSFMFLLGCSMQTVQCRILSIQLNAFLHLRSSTWASHRWKFKTSSSPQKEAA